MNPLPPVITVDLFPEERAALLTLLESLADDQWAIANVYPGWDVKDIVQHLLADDLGRLSRDRDAYAQGNFAFTAPATFEADLLDFINRQNEIWVQATRRLSPRVLIDLLRVTGEQTQAYWQSLDLHAIGEPVSWAGPDPAPVWLDVAREFTERWLHQQHIRDAVSAPSLTDPRLFVPVLDTFVRALPHTFRAVIAPEGAHVRLTITGLGATNVPPSLVAQGSSPERRHYDLIGHDSHWQLFTDVDSTPVATVTLAADTAWRLFTKSITSEDARALCTLEGDIALAENVLNTVSIIA
ncbi:MAG: maleylpyruvate isomerase family mycothiol-dependent enzyme [Chloroflexi bacterium]|nr:maleylpyruvate isomerase family mycothiol-dependent enzyme [Chloroflexota bacterium]